MRWWLLAVFVIVFFPGPMLILIVLLAPVAVGALGISLVLVTISAWIKELR